MHRSQTIPERWNCTLVPYAIAGSCRETIQGNTSFRKLLAAERRFAALFVATATTIEGIRGTRRLLQS
jgi:hypothetical protein